MSTTTAVPPIGVLNATTAAVRHFGVPRSAQDAATARRWLRRVLNTCATSEADGHAIEIVISRLIEIEAAEKAEFSRSMAI